MVVEKNPHLLRLSANPALSTDDKVRVRVDRDNGWEVREGEPRVGRADGTCDDLLETSLKKVEVNTTKSIKG